MKTKSLNLKTIAIVLLLFSCVFAIYSHDAHYENVQLKEWHLGNSGKHVHASFLLMKGDTVMLELESGQVKKFGIQEFAETDKKWLLEKQAKINLLNARINSANAPLNPVKEKSNNWIIYLLIGLVLILLFYIFNKKFATKNIKLFVAGAAIFSIFGLTNQAKKMNAAKTSIGFLDSAFSYFKPKINTFWDTNFYYIESRGIADHEMMKGIVSWQQQVPVPQCYIGSNAWPIPMKPEPAAIPVPVNAQHFLRGAIAVAVNGIPIFNPFTNTGVDAKVDGQLDDFGGHSGRADDYHYHIAPLVLYNVIPETSPVAFALDGYPIYGAKEPDGTSMKTLDSNHGHFGKNGMYHYHGTDAFPYMIGKMYGKVTEDNTMQIIPQAAAKPIRPSLTPLKGAVITGCKPYLNGMGFRLSYTVSGQPNFVDYSWDNVGNYTYKFVHPTDSTIENYKGFVQCKVVAGTTNTKNNFKVKIYYNHTSQDIHIDGLTAQEIIAVQAIEVISMSGNTVVKWNGFKSKIGTDNFATGYYLVRIKNKENIISKKILVQR